MEEGDLIPVLELNNQVPGRQTTHTHKEQLGGML